MSEQCPYYTLTTNTELRRTILSAPGWHLSIFTPMKANVTLVSRMCCNTDEAQHLSILGELSMSSYSVVRGPMLQTNFVDLLYNVVHTVISRLIKIGSGSRIRYCIRALMNSLVVVDQFVLDETTREFF